MKRYWVQSKNQIFVIGNEVLSFPKKMGKNIGKKITKGTSSKYSQKHFDCAKKPATDGFKNSSNKFIQKTAETNGDLIGNKSANKNTKVSKNLETVQRQLRMIKKFKTSMLRSSLCDYSDVYILVKRTITIALVPPPSADLNNNGK